MSVKAGEAHAMVWRVKLWSWSRLAALPSATMITRQPRVLASRAEDSEHTFVTVPVISTVLMSRAASSAGSGQWPGKNALAAVFSASRSPGCTWNSSQSRPASGPSGRRWSSTIRAPMRRSWVDLLVAPARERHEIEMYPVLDVLGLRHGDEQQRQRPVRREQQSLQVVGSIAVVRVFAEPGQLRPELRQAVGISAVEGDALDAYGHGATFRRRRYLRLRSVSQHQEARKPTSTRVSHLHSTQPIQTARHATAMSLANPAGRSLTTHQTMTGQRAERTELVNRARRPRRGSCQHTRDPPSAGSSRRCGSRRPSSDWSSGVGWPARSVEEHQHEGVFNGHRCTAGNPRHQGRGVFLVEGSAG